MLNKVMLIGNLGKDPDCKNLENGNSVANFTIATTETYKDKSGAKQTITEWHNVVFYGKIVNIIEKYLKKGSKVYIEGKIKTTFYEKDGVKKYTTNVIGSSMNMLSSLNSGGEKDKQTYSSESDYNDLPF